jgi:hypothetical protein
MFLEIHIFYALVERVRIFFRTCMGSCLASMFLEFLLSLTINELMYVQNALFKKFMYFHNTAISNA